MLRGYLTRGLRVLLPLALLVATLVAISGLGTVLVRRPVAVPAVPPRTPASTAPTLPTADDGSGTGPTSSAGRVRR